jgi:hypothetical protein
MEFNNIYGINLRNKKSLYRVVSEDQNLAPYKQGPGPNDPDPVTHCTVHGMYNCTLDMVLANKSIKVKEMQ